MEFKASKSMAIQIITIGVIILFAFIGYKSLTGLLHAKGNLTLILTHSGVLLFLTATILICYLLAPKKYSIDKDNFIVHRPMSDIIIPLDSIKDIRIAGDWDLKGMIRTFGVGGLFGNYGKFYSQGLGSVTMYGTQTKNFVLIKTESRKILITPDDLGLIEEIKRRKQGSLKSSF
jgi:hypothetical protein